MNELTFEVFSGVPDRDAVWLESVEGFSNARERMEQIAEQKPGQYFVFSPQHDAILVQI
jgi:hypothetical protein